MSSKVDTVCVLYTRKVDSVRVFWIMKSWCISCLSNQHKLIQFRVWPRINLTLTVSVLSFVPFSGQHAELDVPALDSGRVGQHRRLDRTRSQDGRVSSRPSSVQDVDRLRWNGLFGWHSHHRLVLLPFSALSARFFSQNLQSVCCITIFFLTSTTLSFVHF